jgi:hypothetical protein
MNFRPTFNTNQSNHQSPMRGPMDVASLLTGTGASFPGFPHQPPPSPPLKQSVYFQPQKERLWEGFRLTLVCTVYP